MTTTQARGWLAQFNCHKQRTRTVRNLFDPSEEISTKSRLTGQADNSIWMTGGDD
jgi:hypothetical protein